VAAAIETHHDGAAAVADSQRGTTAIAWTHGYRGCWVSREAARGYWEAQGGQTDTALD
jgi:hypothetical protein